MTTTQRSHLPAVPAVLLAFAFVCGAGCGENKPAPPPSGATGGSSGARSGGSGVPTGTGGVEAPGSGGSGVVAPGTGGAPGSGGSPGVDAPVDAPIGNVDGPAPEAPPVNPAGGLRIYFIDAEGGSATLLIAPTGQSLLADSGWGQRDVNRVLAVLEKETGKKELDYFLATHYHVDHVAGSASLARAATIKNFIDHGNSVEGGGDYNTYRGAVTAAMGEAKRLMATPGLKVMLGEVEITILTAGGKVATGLPTAIANPACAGATARNDAQDEDPQSVGFVARHGRFEFVALGDLTAGVEHRLVCPMNQVGEVDMFQASQHGSGESNPQVLAAGFASQVVVFNNGAGKGGDGAIFERFRKAPGIKDVWSLHRKGGQGDMQNADEALIANSGGPDMAHFIRANVQADGNFTVTNGRTNLSRSYTAR